MPGKEGEALWKAARTITHTTDSPVENVVREVAAWIYHRYCLHQRENPLNWQQLRQKTVETFKHLTPADLDALKRAHDKLPPHKY